MSRFVLVTWDGGGNQPPALGLGQELRAGGHTVRFAGYASQQARITERGFPFQLLEGSQAALQERVSGDPWSAFLEGILVCPAQLEEVPQAVAGEEGTVLVLDCMLFAALAAAECSRVPAAVLVHSAPGALLQSDSILLAPELRALLNALRARAGLLPVEHVGDTWRPFPTLCATVPELDPFGAEAPPTFDYVGPIFDRVPRSAWRAPWPPDDPRPLVVVSFSTHMDQGSRIQRTLEGLATRPYRVLVTTSGADLVGLDPPANVALVEYVPHAEVLPGAAAVVTHAGHGTVTISLAHGVPLVCLPIMPISDQIPLAARVEALGAGRALEGEAATALEIAAAVDEVIADQAYGVAARRLASAIAARPGATLAAARLEQLAEEHQFRA